MVFFLTNVRQCCSTAETDLQKIRQALKILSESEKQLRVSKNQTTWLTVALLQFNSIDSSFSDPNESRLSVRTANFEGKFYFPLKCYIIRQLIRFLYSRFAQNDPKIAQN